MASVSSLWADEGVYYPLDGESYTSSHQFGGVKSDPTFRTELNIAAESVELAV